MLFWVGNGFREVKGCGKGCEWCREVGNGGWNGWEATAEKGRLLEWMEKWRIEGILVDGE